MVHHLPSVQAKGLQQGPTPLLGPLVLWDDGAGLTGARALWCQCCPLSHRTQAGAGCRASAGRTHLRPTQPPHKSRDPSAMRRLRGSSKRCWPHWCQWTKPMLVRPSWRSGEGRGARRLPCLQETCCACTRRTARARAGALRCRPRARVWGAGLQSYAYWAPSQVFRFGWRGCVAQPLGRSAWLLA